MPGTSISAGTDVYVSSHQAGLLYGNADGAAEASHAQNKEGNDYEDGEEDVYGNPFGK